MVKGHCLNEGDKAVGLLYFLINANFKNKYLMTIFNFNKKEY